MYISLRNPWVGEMKNARTGYGGKSSSTRNTKAGTRVLLRAGSALEIRAEHVPVVAHWLHVMMQGNQQKDTPLVHHLCIVHSATCMGTPIEMPALSLANAYLLVTNR